MAARKVPRLNIPEQDDRRNLRERRSGTICKFDLREVCPQIQAGAVCPHIHMDDGHSSREGSDSDYDGDREEEEQQRERSWREEKAHLGSLGRKRKLLNSSSNDAEEGKKPCAFYIRGLCSRGESCKFAHSSPSMKTIIGRRVWLKFCEGYSQQECNDSNCRYLHVSPEDEELYRNEGVISMDVLAQAVQKAYLLSVPLEVNKPVCKENLDDNCTFKDCPFLHWSREEFLNQVVVKVKSEFQRLCGPPEYQSGLGDDGPSKEIQSDIVQKLLNPSVPNVRKESVPFMNLVPLFPPGMFPAASSKNRDGNGGNPSRNLRLANERMAEENEKYAKYVQALEEENRKIMKALDPEQPSVDLKDIRKRLLHVFEAINSNSNVKLIEKSLNEHKNLEVQMKGRDYECGATVSAAQNPRKVHNRPEDTSTGQQRARRDSYKNNRHSAEDNRRQERNDKSRQHERRGGDDAENPLEEKRKYREEVKWYKCETFESTLKRMQKHHLDWLFRKLLGLAGVIGEQSAAELRKDGITKKKRKSEPCKVFAYSFSEAHSKQVLKEYLEQFGPVLSLYYRKYYAWFNYPNPSIVDKLIDHEEPHVIDRYEIKVIRADEKKYNEEQDVYIVGGNRKPPGEGISRKPGEVVFKDLTDDHDLKSMEDYFWKFGKILRFVCQCYQGFVVYEDCAVAYNVINQLEPHVVNGVAITVLPHAPKGWVLKPRRKETVFVGGLENSVTEADLEKYFGTFGKIVDIDLKKNKRGSSRGYGFVTFFDFIAAEDVVAQETHEIKGKAIKVKPTMHHVRRQSRKYLQSEKDSEKGTVDSDDGDDERRTARLAAQEELKEEYDLMHAKQLGLMEEDELKEDKEEELMGDDEEELMENEDEEEELQEDEEEEF